jgi:hypothetical protein
VARDAIARQFDVDKNSVRIEILSDKGEYRPGLITFQAKKGRSIDLDKMHASIQATRLSGGTGMSMNYLEITAGGEVSAGEKEISLKVAGTGQIFALGEDPDSKPKSGGKSAFQRLREAVGRGEKVTSVTGRVEGWSGGFPVVMRNWPTARKQARLLVTDFETAK